MTDDPHRGGNSSRRFDLDTMTLAIMNRKSIWIKTLRFGLGKNGGTIETATQEYDRSA
jgi:hypothetical protein